jgi:type I restriction enzyme M protein
MTNSVSTSSGSKNGSLEDSANLSDRDIIAAESVEDLQAALAQFAEIASDLKR